MALKTEANLSVVFGDNPARRLEALAAERLPDLVVIPSHGRHARRNLIGHTTHSFVQSTARTVLILPRERLAATTE